MNKALCKSLERKLFWIYNLVKYIKFCICFYNKLPGDHHCKLEKIGKVVVPKQTRFIKIGRDQIDKCTLHAKQVEIKMIILSLYQHLLILLIENYKFNKTLSCPFVLYLFYLYFTITFIENTIRLLQYIVLVRWSIQSSIKGLISNTGSR